MKTLKFRAKLIPSILEMKKYQTWRLFDDKDIKKDDEVILLNWETGEEFAKALIVSVKEKTFAELTKSDLMGHEKYSSNEEMFKEYSKYYNKTIDINTKLKIIKFKITCQK